MNRKTVGGVLFALMSALLWGLTAWLGGRSGESETLSTLALAAGFVAVILTLHTVLYAMFANRKAVNGDWFREHGKPVEAEIIKIDRRGHRSAWRIKARYVDSRRGTGTVFKSDILRANPGKKFQVGDRITVYPHPSGSQRYWMDVGIASENY